MLASFQQPDLWSCTYSKTVYFFPGLWTDEAEFIGGHAYYWAVLVMQ